MLRDIKDSFPRTETESKLNYTEAAKGHYVVCVCKSSKAHNFDSSFCSINDGELWFDKCAERERERAQKIRKYWLGLIFWLGHHRSHLHFSPFLACLNVDYLEYFWTKYRLLFSPSPTTATETTTKSPKKNGKNCKYATVSVSNSKIYGMCRVFEVSSLRVVICVFCCLLFFFNFIFILH